MQISSKRIVESKALPGVSFTVRRLAEQQLATRELQTMKERTRLREIGREWKALHPKDGTPDTEAMQAARQTLDDEFSNIIAKVIKPASILAALVSIANLTVDEKPITNAPALLDVMCPQLQPFADEVFTACEEASTLTEDERKNFLPPTTSSEQVDGGTTDSTVAPAA